MAELHGEAYVVLALERWEGLKTNIGLDMAIQALPGTIGFLPVYADKAKAREDYPDHEIRTIAAAQRP